MAMGTIQYRKIEKMDNVALSQMIKNVFIEFDAPRENTVFSDPTTDHLFELFQRERSMLWVATVDQQAVGCCGIYPTDGLDSNTVELVKFYLEKESRNLGIGKKLMSLCLEEAEKLGYERMYIESLPSFKKAVGMYEKLGFERLESPLGNSGHSGCNIWMLKKIK